MWAWFKTLSGKNKALVVVALIIILAVVSGVAASIGYRVRYAAYQKREAVRMKQVQDALAAADAKTKLAEAKEAKAALLEQQIAAKVKITEADQTKLEEESKRRDEQIQNALQHDNDAINSDMSNCERCRDICTRTATVAKSNPNLAQYQCGANDCADYCQAGN
jgi:uncharacterized protein HemX